MTVSDEEVMPSGGKLAGTGGLTLVPGPRQKLGDQLYGQILSQIVSGRLKEGERLPPEKEISAMFGVSRPIVRDALLRLRIDGLVHARQGSGTYVLRRPSDHLTRFVNAEEVAEYLRCMELRLPIESRAAMLAAERRTEKDLARIEKCHEAFRREAEAGVMSHTVDFDFHIAIAEATGNAFFPQVLRHVEPALQGFMKLMLSITKVSSRERALTVLGEHETVLAAIKASDAEGARVGMEFHITQARRRLVDRTLHP